MTAPRYVLDASSLMLLIKKADEPRTVKCLQESLMLDLTFYEIGNSLWKESTLLRFLKREEVTELIRLSEEVLGKLKRISGDAEELGEILRMATEERITFYDASYIHAAKRERLTLVSDDSRLGPISKKYVNTKSAAEFL